MSEEVFSIAMWWRIVYGFCKIILGIILLQFVGDQVSDVFLVLMRHELVEDPQDALLQNVALYLGHLPYAVTYFLVGYFIFWGALEMILSYNLVKHRLWAFPIALISIALFVLYEGYRFTHTHSSILLGIIVVDLIILFIIYQEYRKLEQALQDREALVVVY